MHALGTASCPTWEPFWPLLVSRLGAVAREAHAALRAAGARAAATSAAGKVAADSAAQGLADGGLDPMAVASCLWALGKVFGAGSGGGGGGDGGEAVLLQLRSHLGPLMACLAILAPRCKAQDLSNAAWGLARLRQPMSADLEAAMEARARALLPSATGATSGATSGACGGASGISGTTAVGQPFKGQELADLMWALGTLAVASPLASSAVSGGASGAGFDDHDGDDAVSGPVGGGAGAGVGPSCVALAGALLNEFGRRAAIEQASGGGGGGGGGDGGGGSGLTHGQVARALWAAARFPTLLPGRAAPAGAAMVAAVTSLRSLCALAASDCGNGGGGGNSGNSVGGVNGDAELALLLGAVERFVPQAALAADLAAAAAASGPRLTAAEARKAAKTKGLLAGPAARALATSFRDAVLGLASAALAAAADRCPTAPPLLLAKTLACAVAALEALPKQALAQHGADPSLSSLESDSESESDSDSDGGSKKDKKRAEKDKTRRGGAAVAVNGAVLAVCMECCQRSYVAGAGLPPMAVAQVLGSLARAPLSRLSTEAAAASASLVKSLVASSVTGDSGGGYDEDNDGEENFSRAGARGGFSGFSKFGFRDLAATLWALGRLAAHASAGGGSSGGGGGEGSGGAAAVGAAALAACAGSFDGGSVVRCAQLRLAACLSRGGASGGGGSGGSGDVSAQSVANCVWSLVGLGGFMEAELAHAIADGGDEGTATEQASTIGSGGGGAGRLCGGRLSVGDFKGREAASLLWGLARLDHSSFRLARGGGDGGGVDGGEEESGDGPGTAIVPAAPSAGSGVDLVRALAVHAAAALGADAGAALAAWAKTSGGGAAASTKAPGGAVGALSLALSDAVDVLWALAKLRPTEHVGGKEEHSLRAGLAAHAGKLLAALAASSSPQAAAASVLVPAAAAVSAPLLATMTWALVKLRVLAALDTAPPPTEPFKANGGAASADGGRAVHAGDALGSLLAGAAAAGRLGSVQLGLAAWGVALWPGAAPSEGTHIVRGSDGGGGDGGDAWAADEGAWRARGLDVARALAAAALRAHGGGDDGDFADGGGCDGSAQTMNAQSVAHVDFLLRARGLAEPLSASAGSTGSSSCFGGGGGGSDDGQALSIGRRLEVAGRRAVASVNASSGRNDAAALAALAMALASDEPPARVLAAALAPGASSSGSSGGSGGNSGGRRRPATVLVVGDPFPGETRGVGGLVAAFAREATAATNGEVCSAKAKRQKARVEKGALRIVHWNRFCCGPVKGNAWPPGALSDPPTDGSSGGGGPGAAVAFDACVMRLPPTGDAGAVSLALAGASAALGGAGKPLWVCGTRAEGATAGPTLAALAAWRFANARPHANCRNRCDGGAVVTATTVSSLTSTSFSSSSSAPSSSGSTGGASGDPRARGLAGWASLGALALPPNLFQGGFGLGGGGGSAASEATRKCDAPCGSAPAAASAAAEAALVAGAASLGQSPSAWVTYPGLFAGGFLDVMTAFLLRHLPPDFAGGDGDGRRSADAATSGATRSNATAGRLVRVLDFACGSGVIASALLRRHVAAHASLSAGAVTSPPTPRSLPRLLPRLLVDALDADAVAVDAAVANLSLAGTAPPMRVAAADAGGAAATAARLLESGVVAGSRVLLSNSWDLVDRNPGSDGGGAGVYDHIVSNPPLHNGKALDFSVLKRLIDGAPGHLRAGGSLWIVTQNSVPAGPLLDATFGPGGRVDLVSDGRFALWRAVTGHITSTMTLDSIFKHAPTPAAKKTKSLSDDSSSSDDSSDEEDVSANKMATPAKKKVESSSDDNSSSDDSSDEEDVSANKVATPAAKKAEASSEGSSSSPSNDAEGARPGKRSVKRLSHQLTTKKAKPAPLGATEPFHVAPRFCYSCGLSLVIPGVNAPPRFCFSCGTAVAVIAP